MIRTAPWMTLAVFCSLTPGLALASWDRNSSQSSDEKPQARRARGGGNKDDGKKDDGDKNGGPHGRGQGNGGRGGVAVGGSSGNNGNGHGGGGGGVHQADPPGDRHGGRGRGHTDHGNGQGYGHDRQDHDDDDDHADNGGHPATGGGPGSGGGGRSHGDHDDGGYVVVDRDPVYVGPRWGWGWGWWGGGHAAGDEERAREHRAPSLRVRLLGEASGASSYSAAVTQGSLMGSVRVEGPRWGVVLDGRSVVDSTVMELGPRYLGLGSAHLTYALFSGRDGGRLRLEAGAASLVSLGAVATGPSVGASAELPLFLGLGIEGGVHATAFPFVSASWSAGGYASLGALSLHVGARRLFVDPTSAGTGPYVAVALTFG